MKLATIVLLFGAVVAALALKNGPAAVAAGVAYTPQEQYLAKQPYGNFACRVNGVSVSVDNPGSGESPVNVTQVRQAFAEVASLEWAHIAQSSFGSADGRNEEKILSTPGGDLGEFIQGLEAFTKIQGKVLTEEDVQKVFEYYLKTATREKFFYETDEKAYMRLALATGCKNLHVAEMGGMKRKREAYLARIAEPEHIGDPFIRFLAQNGATLGVRTEYVQFALAAYHKVLWSTPSRLASKLCYLRVQGKHEEAALVNIRTPAYCVDQGLAPMASPQTVCTAPVVLNHPDAVKIFRRELVSAFSQFFKVTDPKVERNTMDEFNKLAQDNFAKYWDELSQGQLPVFTVTFENTASILKEDVSFE